MTAFDAFLHTLSNPMDLLADFNRQAAQAAGIKPATYTKWEKAHTVYYGPTKYTRQQATAITTAKQTNKSLDQILFIEHHIRTLKTEHQKWTARIALLSIPGDYNTLRQRAPDIAPTNNETPTPQNTVRFTKSRNGKRSFTATGDEHDIAALEYALRRSITPDRPEGPQMYEAFSNLLFTGNNTSDSNSEDATSSNSGTSTGGGASIAGSTICNTCGTSSGGGVARAVPRPMILVPVDDHITIINGDGDDTTLGLTDGTTITGAEYLAKYYGDKLEVALFHPQAGPVNLYSTQRFANTKQRDLARATLTTCPVPGCRHAADNCEIHHITAWSHGGHTNMNNLSVLCRYHNRTNDDDPNHNHRGRIINRNGTPTWVSPYGKPAPNTTHPYGAMHLLFGA